MIASAACASAASPRRPSSPSPSPPSPAAAGATRSRAAAPEGAAAALQQLQQQRSASSSGTAGSGGSGGGATVDDVLSSLPASCAFDCSACPEPETPFSCPTLDAWDKLPHDAACDWDGKTYPAVTQGKCTVSAPTGDAAQPAGPLKTGGLVLPDGRRIQPAGVDYVFAEPDLQGGYPMNVLPLAGTRFALVSDGGIQDNALRLVDVNALAAGSAPVASYTPFHEPTSIFWGLAWLPPGAALASGGGDGMVYAFDVDTTQGTLARAGARDIDVGLGDDGSPYYVGPIAATPDGQRLLVGPSDHATELRIFSLGASDYGTQLATVDVGIQVRLRPRARPLRRHGQPVLRDRPGGGRAARDRRVGGDGHAHACRSRRTRRSSSSSTRRTRS